jgi:energy-coupling factor transporter ATP-binding protein EcfA2
MPIILADEPMGNLDGAASAELIDFLHTIAHDKLIIALTHSADQFSGTATREIVLQNGEIISDRRFDGGNRISEKQKEHIKLNEVAKKKRKVGRLIKSDIFSDVKNSASFVCVTTLVMLVVLLLGSIFAQSSTRYYEGITNTLCSVR